MDVKILTYKYKEYFYLDKFNIPFKYNNQYYEVTVYLKNVKSSELEESVLTSKVYQGEYILNGVKLMFNSTIYLEKYYVSEKYNTYFCFSSFDEM